jgi:hypothetical protein
MENAKQTSLFETEFPRSLECSGAELPALLASLRERGAVVLGMTSVCVSRWRLSLDWRNAAKARFRSTGVQTG